MGVAGAGAGGFWAVWACGRIGGLYRLSQYALERCDESVLCVFGWSGGEERGEREKSRELQEACFRYWEIGCNKVAVKNSRNGKPRYEDVFNYYQRELAAIGVKDVGEFSKYLIRRQKRLSQSANLLKI